MNKKIEDLVNSYIKDPTNILNFNGQAEYNLRNWGRLRYNRNPFKKCTNDELWEKFLKARDNVRRYDPSLADGRERIICDPEDCVRARDTYKYIRHEMYKRGILDAVYDRWDKDDEEIINRLKEVE